MLTTDEDKQKLSASRSKFKLKIGGSGKDVQDESKPSKKLKTSPSSLDLQQKSLSEPKTTKKREDEDDIEDEHQQDEAVSLLLHEVMINSVVEHYAPIFSVAEHAIMSKFHELSQDAKDVFVRLHGRKYRVFRCSTLNIKKATQLEGAILELSKAKFLSIVNYPLDLMGEKERACAFLRLARVTELRSIASSLGVVDRQKLSQKELVRQLSEMCCDVEVKRDEKQSKLSYSGVSSAKKAQMIDSKLCKLLTNNALKTSSSAPSVQTSTILTMWKKTSEPPTVSSAETKEEQEGKLSQQFISKNGVAIVLGHAVSSLFDRIEMLYFLNVSSIKTVIMSWVQKVKYPEISASRFGSPFLTRKQMIEYEGTSHLLDQFIKALGLSQSIDYGSNEVPVPGRSLQSVESNDGEFLEDMIWLSCQSFLEENMMLFDRDPLKDTNCLETELKQKIEGKNRKSLRIYIEDMYDEEKRPLRCYEPKVLGKDQEEEEEEEEEELVISQKLSDSQQRMYMRRFRKEYILLYLLKFGVDWLEKERKYDDAVLVLRSLLCLSDDIRSFVKRKIGALWLRLSINLVHLEKDKAKAWKVAKWCLEKEKELSLAYSIKMKQRLVMLSKSLKKEIPEFEILEQLKKMERITISGHLITKKVGRKSVFEGVDGDGVSVEEYVLQYYAQQGWSGIHTEGSVWRSIFCLLMWDIIFDPDIPFVFQHIYQSEPLDMNTYFFYENRKEMIVQYLDLLKEENVEVVSKLLRETYEKNHGCVCPGVKWSYSADMLCEIVEAINPKSLAELLLYAAKDFRSFGKGLPDLTLWRKSGSTRILVVEVKGPRDRLFAEQEAHLIKLNEIGIRAIVCHVSETTEEEEEEEEEED